MDWSIGLQLVLAFVLILLNGFFVLAEFALVKVRSTRIEELARQGHLRAKIAREMLSHLDAYLSVTQLGITVASLGLGWVGEPVFSRLLERLIGPQVWMAPKTTHVLSMVVAYTNRLPTSLSFCR